VDARRAEVYAALYRVVAERDPELLWGPEAVSCVALAEKFTRALPSGGKVAAGVLSGDGAALLAPLFPAEAGWDRPSVLARPSARGVARAAARHLAAGGGVSPEELQPVYLRKSDAEIHRERRASSGD
jgi:tRNA A37 threonylcarbamoyladenosine modification protein TsaB